jgi:hypothetical protein
MATDPVFQALTYTPFDPRGSENEYVVQYGEVGHDGAVVTVVGATTTPQAVLDAVVVPLTEPPEDAPAA